MVESTGRLQSDRNFNQALIELDDLKKAIQRKKDIQAKKQLDSRFQYMGTNNRRPGPSLEPTIHETYKLADAKSTLLQVQKY